MPAPTLTIQTEIVSRLSSADQKHLETLEAKVEGGFMDFAIALHEIRTYKDGLLWRDNHPSFEEYAQVRFSYQKQHAYRLAAAGAFVSKLDTKKSSAPKPIRESQIRPLLNKIPEEHQVDCWEKMTTECKVSELTGDVVTSQVLRYQANLPKTQDQKQKKPKRPKEDKEKIQSRARDKAFDLVEKLESAAEPLPRAKEILDLLAKIEKLIQRKS